MKAQPTPDAAPARDPAVATTLAGSSQEPASSNPPKRTPERLDSQTENLSSVARLQAALQERYIIKRAAVTLGDLTVGRTEYRFRGDTSRVAFTESSFRLATDTNSPSVARSMVDAAEARQWKALRVAGSEDFRRLVWLEASARGVKTLGYEPDPADLELLGRERDARASNRIEPAPGRNSASEPTSVQKRAADPTSTAVTAQPATKGSARGGSRKAVLAAIEAVLFAQRVPEARRLAVMAAAAQQLAQRLRDGLTPQVKVYDKAAPSHRPVVVTTPEPQRSRDRAAPSPSR